MHEFSFSAKLSTTTSLNSANFTYFCPWAGKYTLNYLSQQYLDFHRVDRNTSPLIAVPNLAILIFFFQLPCNNTCFPSCDDPCHFVILSFFAEFKRHFILYHLFSPLSKNQKKSRFPFHTLPSSTTRLNKLKDVTIKRYNHLPCH